MRRQEPSDFVGTYPIWLLDLHYAGTVYRIATEPVNVDDGTGLVLSYQGGLDAPELTEQLQLSATDVPNRSASLSVVLPESVAKLRAAGHSLLYATAELFLTFCSEDARRLQVAESKLTHPDLWYQISGRVASPVWGTPGEAPGFLEFTLRQNPWTDRRPVVRPDLVIDSNRFSGALAVPGPPPEDADGKVMPLVVGAPGTSRSPASPVYALERDGAGNANQLLIALGRVNSATCQVFDQSNNKETLDVVVIEDRYNTPVSYVVPSTLSRSDEQFYATWPDTAAPGFGQGLQNPIRAAAYLFALSALEVDLPAWLAASEYFSGMIVGGYVNDDSTAWDVASRNLLPLVPVSYRFTREGLTPVIYDPELRAGQEGFWVDVIDTPTAAGAGDWSPLTGVELEKEPEAVPNQITVRYALDIRSNSYRRSRTWLSDVSAAARPLGNPRREGPESLSLYLDQAQTRSSLLASVEIEASWVYDDATADQILAWRSRLDTMARERTTYRAPWHYGALQVGDVGRLTDSGKSWAEVFVLITSRTWEGDSWVFEVVKFEEPLSQTRP